MNMYAVVRIRGTAKIRKNINETLNYLRLQKPNHCVIVPETDSYKGMLKKAKDYISWGEVSEDMIKKLADAKGITKGNDKENQYKGEVFALAPPRKGHERAGIKKTFVQGGALGYRKDKINELIERMI